ncbi:MAG: SRPBCC family protein [Actinomycetota bacterium]|nr:SRPBCC family protein [Actinomycetota bacterium]
MIEVEGEARSAAPPERVWELLADARSWTRWAGFDEADVEAGEGVGEVRRNRRGRITGRDRVTVFEPPRRYAYESSSVLPVRDYQGEVTLTPTGDAGTQIRWRSRFAAKMPGTGWLLRRGLRRFLAELADGLAREAERGARTS